MSSRSSSRAGEERLTVGRVLGHRGAAGELTLKGFGGDAALWTGISRLWLARTSEDEPRLYDVQRARAYKDRLVVKLEGIDDADAAARLRGAQVIVDPCEAQDLPEGHHYVDSLIGSEVWDEGGRHLGPVVGLIPTGGTDVLRVDRADQPGEELLIPLAREIVIRIDERQRRIDVRLPDGLEELNRRGG